MAEGEKSVAHWGRGVFSSAINSLDSRRKPLFPMNAAAQKVTQVNSLSGESASLKHPVVAALSKKEEHPGTPLTIPSSSLVESKGSSDIISRTTPAISLDKGEAANSSTEDPPLTNGVPPFTKDGLKKPAQQPSSALPSSWALQSSSTAKSGIESRQDAGQASMVHLKVMLAGPIDIRCVVLSLVLIVMIHFSINKK